MKIVGAPTWVVRFLSIAICAVGAVSACTSTSSSSSSTSAGDGQAIGDAGPDETPTDTPEAGADAGSDGKDGGADAACGPSPVGVATVDAGALFGCYQTACASELSGCAADCVCNAAIMSGLLCLLADAGSAESCFYSPIVRNASNVAVRSAGTCLQLVLMDGGCERSTGGQPEGGGDAAGQMAAEGGADAGAEGSADAGAEGSADAGGEIGNDSDESDAPTGD